MLGALYSSINKGGGIMRPDQDPKLFDEAIERLEFASLGWCFYDVIGGCDGTSSDFRYNSACKACQERHKRCEGAPVPKEFQGTQFGDFFTWKNYQHIEYKRLSGEYTDAQAEKARKVYTEYLRKRLRKENEISAENRERADILNKLFGNSK